MPGAAGTVAARAASLRRHGPADRHGYRTDRRFGCRIRDRQRVGAADLRHRDRLADARPMALSRRGAPRLGVGLRLGRATRVAGTTAATCAPRRAGARCLIHRECGDVLRRARDGSCGARRCVGLHVSRHRRGPVPPLRDAAAGSAPVDRPRARGDRLCPCTRWHRRGHSTADRGLVVGVGLGPHLLGVDHPVGAAIRRAA